MNDIIQAIKAIAYPASAYFFWICQRHVEPFTILAILIIVDFATWIIKSWVVSWGRSITSKKAKSWLISKLLLLLVPLMIWLVATWIWLDWIDFVKTIAWLLMVSELYSIIANILAIRVWKDVFEYDAITAILKYLLRTVKKFLEEKVQ